MSKLQIDIGQDPAGTTILTMSGSAGLAEEAAMERPLNGLAAARPQRLIINLNGVDFLASLAIGQIVNVVRAVHSHGGSAVIVCNATLIRQSLLRCGLDRMLPICANDAEAEQALAAKRV